MGVSNRGGGGRTVCNEVCSVGSCRARCLGGRAMSVLPGTEGCSVSGGGQQWGTLVLWHPEGHSGSVTPRTAEGGGHVPGGVAAGTLYLQRGEQVGMGASAWGAKGFDLGHEHTLHCRLVHPCHPTE